MNTNIHVNITAIFDFTTIHTTDFSTSPNSHFMSAMTMVNGCFQGNYVIVAENGVVRPFRSAMVMTFFLA